MNKIVVALGTVMLAGCAAQTPAPTVTVTAPPPVVAPAPTHVPEPEPRIELNKDQVFVLTIEKKYGPISSSQERKLIKFAKGTCSLLESYGVKETLRQYLGEVDTPREARFLGYVVGAGVATYCPRYRDAIEGYAT